MKDGINEILGKTITGIVVSKKPGSPGQQVFLIFNDGTYFEFWGESFTGAGGVDAGGIEKVRLYVAQCGSDTILEIERKSKI